MTVTLGPLVVDAADPAAVETFWRAALGDDQFEQYVRVEREHGPKMVKNRVHLDVYVRDVPSLLALGATVLDDYPPTRATLADIEGNEFCAFIDEALDADAPARAFAVCTDSDRPDEIAAWWAPLVGARLGPGPDGVPRYLDGCAGWPDLVWKFVGVDDPRIAPNRWRWSVQSWENGPLLDPDGNDFSVAR